MGVLLRGCRREEAVVTALQMLVFSKGEMQVLGTIMCYRLCKGFRCLEENTVSPQKELGRPTSERR